MSTSELIELRSDTVTRPSTGMRRAMFEADDASQLATRLRVPGRAAGLMINFNSRLLKEEPSALSFDRVHCERSVWKSPCS